MNVDEIKKVIVAGGGLMGRQIALNAAIHGIEVGLFDANEQVLEDVEQWKNSYLLGRIKKGRMSEAEVAEAEHLFHIVRDIETYGKDVDLLIEAIIEDKEIKRSFFKKMNGILKKEAIIATNSSFLYSSMFADCVDEPGRLANLHFFNPALVMKLTEVVQGPQTTVETVQCLMDFSRKVGKDPIWVKKEIEGFIANRILRAVANEALYLVEEGVATPQEIDTAAEEGLNYPMGPFKLMDLTGVDLSYFNLKRVYDETGEKKPGFDLLEAKYNAKEWGRKTGKGWYEYK